jgi:hypothetical protein
MKEATIKAERLDAHAEHGNNPVNAVIENPVGEFPTEAFHEANERVQDRFDVSDFRHDGDEFVAGTVAYDAESFQISLN